MRRIRFAVTGRVQGVGYRHFATLQARALGVSGWVRNEVDGSVCGEVEGEVAQVAAFLAALQQGPHFARVLAVATEELASEGGAGFTVR